MEKVYTLAAVQTIASKNSLPIAALTSYDNISIVPFNTNPKKINLNAQFKKFEQRLNSELCEDGYYKILLAENIRAAKSPREFTISKGNVKQMPPVPQQQAVTFVNPLSEAKETLSLHEAIELHQKLAKAEASLDQYKKQNELLQKKINELEAEVNSLDDDAPVETGFSSFTAMLKDLAPGLMGGWEKKLQLEERRLDLLEKGKVNDSAKRIPVIGRIVKKELEVGTEAHMNYLQSLFDNNNLEKLTIELSKLEAANKDLWQKFVDANKIEFTEDE